ncbi:sporulation integral membrane protein YtvI [Evansella cellulosilytica]|uniref:Sporulation integral membrane protein YtvI n=1 Tax=Evansella cellulosilytica (strain ATCC 21833 / DSM 2522 / FERM P-1141 / JCM 9156 / N-4) TaxID=649639 RepID=E6TUJ3_EVAC2|nr:sporulation integral membrane protein YtvI [Evansella cellulosilytica]ADU30883.1 sporulation integral membrane protein YtvI [Evansella cellulosilytica DSM 2522]
MATSASIKKYIYIVLGIIVAALLLYFVLPVSVPIIVALITALFLAPIVNVLIRRAKLSRSLAVFIVFISFVLVISLIVYFLLTRAITQLNSFIENLPYTINEIAYAWTTFLNNIESQFGQYSPDLRQEIDDVVMGFLIETRMNLQEIDLVGHVTSILIKIPSYIVSLLVYLIALYLFLMDLPRLKEKAMSYMTDKTAEKVTFMASRLSYVVFGFFKAQFLVSIIIFVVTLIGLWIIAPEVAIIMSIVIWVIDFIPIIGSIAVLAPWALYHIIAGNTALAVQLLVLAAILLTIRRTVEPKVMGHHIGLSPLATLISLFIGLQLLGVLGFILGPLVVILFTSAKEAGIIKFNFKI